MLAGLLAPLRLPERVVEALESLADAAGNLDAIRAELILVRKQTEPLGELLPALHGIQQQVEPLGELLPALERLEGRLGTRLDAVHEVVVALEGDDSHLSQAVGELQGELAAMHVTLRGLQDDVQRVTERLPDPSRGPLEKAKDALTAGGD